MITFVDKPPPNTSRWGVTTGCFTVDNEATNSPDQVFSAARNGVRRLSEEEVSEVTRLSISAERSLTDLLGAANKTKNSWEKAAKIPGKDPSLTVAIDDGNKSLRDLGNLRIKAFREVDALMVYAQSPILAKQAHDSAARYAASISDSLNFH